MRGEADGAPSGAVPYEGDAGSDAESTSVAPEAPARALPSVLSNARSFRDAAAFLTARLLRRYGARELSRVEDAVQDAFVAAVRSWRVAGAPAEPMAWLSRVATRRYLDRVRGDRRLEWQPNAGHEEADEPPAATPGDTPFDDDALRLLFLCCHEALSTESRVALTLKSSAQFSVEEIARLLRAEPAAVAQRLVRAKRTLRQVGAEFVTPPPAVLPDRLDDVLAVCYALFAEGHLVTSGATLMRPELCHEALRLILLLVSWPPTARPQTQALLALLCFTAARLPARSTIRSDGGRVAVSLRDQDRTQWSRSLIARGVRAFAAAADGTTFTRYHAEAEIALHHTTAASWEATPWPAIVMAYDRLLATAPTSTARLSRWVAMAEAGAADAALDEITRTRAALDRDLYAWPEWWATLGLLYARVGRPHDALAAYKRALTFPVAEPVRRFWQHAHDAILPSCA